MDGSIFFSSTFEIVIIIFLAVLTLLLFTGHGDFATKSKNLMKKRTPEEEKQIQKKLGCVTGLWLIAEVMMYFFSGYLIASVAYIVILVVSVIYLVSFFGKNN